MKPYTLPELPYDYSALEPHYSARQVELHHSKHHAAYVEGANAVLEKLEAALAWEPVGKSLVVEQIYDHQGNIGNGTVPLLVLDMWEHAYYLQYENVKAKWVGAFWKIVNWQDVAQRFAKVRKLDLGLDAPHARAQARERVGFGA